MDAPTTGSAAATGDEIGLATVLSTDFLLSPSGNKVCIFFLFALSSGIISSI